MTHIQERVESVLAAPPAGATGLLILGYQLSDVVLWLNFTYVALLLVYKLYKIWKDDIQGGNDGRTY